MENKSGWSAIDPLADISAHSYLVGMTLLAKAMLVVFIAAWFIGVAAWFYGTCFFLPIWATGFRKTDKRKAYIRKALKGYGVFLLAVGFGFTAGGIAEY